MTLARALSSADNYTVGHETKAAEVRGRLDYPDQHVEVDNRLAWFLGGLAARYGHEPLYVHQRRDEHEVALSYFHRWKHDLARRAATHRKVIRRPKTLLRLWRRARGDPDTVGTNMIPRAFARGIVTTNDSPLGDVERLELMRLYVATVNENIAHFCATRSSSMAIDLDCLDSHFEQLWDRIGATGDFHAGRLQLRAKMNSNRDRGIYTGG